MAPEKKRKVLGKGLGALLPAEEVADDLTKEKPYLMCPIERIHPNRYQPRKVFDDAKLNELVNSVREKGVIQPLIARRDGDSDYELIAGERRWRAAQRAGLREVPVVVRDVSDEESLELAIIENIQRADLNPVEEAEGYQRLIKEFSYTQEELASRVGKDRATISNHLRILKLPEEVKGDMAGGTISMGHAKALLSLEKRGDILEAKREIVKKGLSVRDAEALARKLKRGKVKGKEKGGKSPHILRLEDRLTTFFGTKTRIVGGDKRGRVEIVFYSGDELDRIIELLGI